MKRIIIPILFLILSSSNVFCRIFQDTLVDLRGTPLSSVGINKTITIKNTKSSKLHILNIDYKYYYPYVYHYYNVKTSFSIINNYPAKMPIDFVLAGMESYYSTIALACDKMDSVSHAGGYFRSCYFIKYKWEDDPVIYTDSLPIIFSSVSKSKKLESKRYSTMIRQNCPTDSLIDSSIGFYIQNNSDSTFKVESIDFTYPVNNVHSFKEEFSIPDDSLLTKGIFSGSAFSANPDPVGVSLIYCNAVLKNIQSGVNVVVEDSIFFSTKARQKLQINEWFDSRRTFIDSIPVTIDTAFFNSIGACNSEQIFINEINVYGDLTADKYNWLFEYDFPVNITDLPVNPENGHYFVPLLTYDPHDLLGKDALIEIKYTADGENLVGYCYLTVDKIHIYSGIDDPISDSQINIFPNPSTGVLNFRNPVEQIKIFDIYGKAILEHKDMTDKIELYHLSNGFYIVTYIDSNGVMKSERVMLAK